MQYNFPKMGGRVEGRLKFFRKFIQFGSRTLPLVIHNKQYEKGNPGHADNLHKLTIARLDSGDAAILVVANGARTFTLKVGNNN